jgi:hypothetical protein
VDASRTSPHSSQRRALQSMRACICWLHMRLPTPAPSDNARPREAHADRSTGARHDRTRAAHFSKFRVCASRRLTVAVAYSSAAHACGGAGERARHAHVGAVACREGRIGADCAHAIVHAVASLAHCEGAKVRGQSMVWRACQSYRRLIITVASAADTWVATRLCAVGQAARTPIER